MKKESKNIVRSLVLTIIAFGYVFLVKTVDIMSIGPKGSKVGFGTINNFVKETFSYSKTIYKITEILGLLALLIVAVYGLVGLVQLIKRKSLFKVDKRIYILGVFYVLVGLIYVFFEKVIINYRPVLMDGKLEASFPSSHTVLAICVCASAIYMNKFYIKDKSKLKLINTSILVLMTLIVVGRLVSGVHWFSDILGGIIISGTLLSYYFTLNKLFIKRHE
jgi:undecaprenyl-diphosphatase